MEVEPLARHAWQGRKTVFFTATNCQNMPNAPEPPERLSRESFRSVSDQGADCSLRKTDNGVYTMERFGAATQMPGISAIFPEVCLPDPHLKEIEPGPKRFRSPASHSGTLPDSLFGKRGATGELTGPARRAGRRRQPPEILGLAAGQPRYLGEREPAAGRQDLG
jgi:hypothetical protein